MLACAVLIHDLTAVVNGLTVGFSRIRVRGNVLVYVFCGRHKRGLVGQSLALTSEIIPIYLLQMVYKFAGLFKSDQQKPNLSCDTRSLWIRATSVWICSLSQAGIPKIANGPSMTNAVSSK